MFPRKLSLSTKTQKPRTGRVNGVQAVIARHGLGKHVSAATYPDATIENTVFPTLSVPRLQNEDKQQQLAATPRITKQ